MNESQSVTANRCVTGRIVAAIDLVAGGRRGFFHVEAIESDRRGDGIERGDVVDAAVERADPDLTRGDEGIGEA